MTMTDKPITLINTMISAITGNAAITSYCNSQFNKQLKFFIGIDDGKMPDPTNMPFMDFRLGQFNPAPDRSYRNIVIRTALVITKSSTTTTGQVTSMDGLTVLQDLYFLIEAALDAVFGSDSWQYQVAWGDDHNTEVALPLFRVTWTFTFQGNY